MGNFFQALFNRKPLSELVKASENTENTNMTHAAFFVNLNNTVTYTIIHCSSNISEGELVWSDYKDDYTVTEDAVKECFIKWLTEAHPKASFKFTELHV